MPAINALRLNMDRAPHHVQVCEAVSADPVAYIVQQIGVAQESLRPMAAGAHVDET
jgi:hypothetical protein